MRMLPLLVLAACGPATMAIDDRAEVGSGWATDPYEEWQTTPSEPDDPWEGAQLTVLSPEAGEKLNWGQNHAFEAQVTAPDGSVLPLEDIEWGSSSAPNWFEAGAAFETDGLPIGDHDFTAWAFLPNGSILQHTVGGVRVQHAYGGTYAGLLDVDGTIASVPISCVGAALVVIDATGEVGLGDGDCVVSLLAVDVPLHLLYDLEIDEYGAITGSVGVDLIGWFTYNFDAEGALDPSGAMDVSFAGDVPLMGPLSGTTSAERISLDTE